MWLFWLLALPFLCSLEFDDSIVRELPRASPNGPVAFNYNFPDYSPDPDSPYKDFSPMYGLQPWILLSWASWSYLNLQFSVLYSNLFPLWFPGTHGPLSVLTTADLAAFTCPLFSQLGPHFNFLLFTLGEVLR